jgi:hypothetical protein
VRLLTLADLVDTSQITELSAYLKTLAPTTPTIIATPKPFDIAGLLSYGQPPVRPLPNEAPFRITISAVYRFTWNTYPICRTYNRCYRGYSTGIRTI